MKKTTKTYILFAIILSLVFNLITVITYDLDVDNCKEILKLEFQIAQHDTVHCVKIINQPIYSYYIPEFLAGSIIAFLIVGVARFIHHMIKEGI
ncbi:MAG: hypothetical protein IIA87_03425 [Nanoarchaeota archaeon]|nr:hypothetical protein [Nanoarchaeota archaeon]